MCIYHLLCYIIINKWGKDKKGDIFYRLPIISLYVATFFPDSLLPRIITLIVEKRHSEAIGRNEANSALREDREWDRRAAGAEERVTWPTLGASRITVVSLRLGCLLRERNASDLAEPILNRRTLLQITIVVTPFPSAERRGDTRSETQFVYSIVAGAGAG